MTLIGKTLVALILVLAFAQAALHIVYHITQRNWVKAYGEVSDKYVVAQAEAQAYREELDKARADAAQDVQKVQAQLEVAQRQVKDEQNTSAGLRAQYEAEREKADKGGAALESSVVDAQRHEEELKRLEEAHKADTDRITGLVTDNNKLRDRAVAAEIEARSYKDRNANLVAKLEEMSKAAAQARAGGGTGGTLSSKNPPNENIEGLVTKTDSSGLITLSIGSDAGLAKGNTLEVFRLNPARYLGTVRIISVTPHEAVAQPVSRPLAPIQVGDRVASRILGS